MTDNEVLQMILSELRDLKHGQQQTNERLDGIDERLDAMDERFDGIDRRLDAMDERFDGIDRRLDAMDERFDGIDRRLDTMQEDIEILKEDAAITRNAANLLFGMGGKAQVPLHIPLDIK